MFKNSKIISYSDKEAGFTLLELIVVMGIMSLIYFGMFASFKALERPLSSGGELTIGFFRLIRASAISRTQSIVIYPATPTQLRAKLGNNCTEARTNNAIDNSLRLQLPTGVRLQSTTWDSCYTSRGFMDTSIEFFIRDNDGKQLKISTFLGGTANLS
jgi:prepilin-type N-terminal cleavage/methylation domain-containing protein